MLICCCAVFLSVHVTCMKQQSTIKRESAEMRALLEHQSEIKDWLHLVENRIFELETSYLEETPLGNIVRGWDIDGKPSTTSRPKHVDEKERIFSLSSYQIWVDSKTQENNLDVKPSDNPMQPKKKSRKSKKDGILDDWDGGDY